MMSDLRQGNAAGLTGRAVSALFTDFYELTMAQGYWKRGMSDHAVFDYFFRRQPYSGGYSVFAGLGSLLEDLAGFRFGQDDLGYLESLGMFESGFLRYLQDFRFRGRIMAAREGEIVFPQEPLARIEADLIQAQVIEGLVLNHLNFQSLIATKAARVWLACGKGQVMEFGLRRAQGNDGALSASRAAYIGGAAGTSNTLAGKTFGIPVMGTMAHSWIMSFADEYEAFKAYADLYPSSTIFLLDTYNTLESGLPNAIKAGAPLRARGMRFGVRLDSGDIDYLSREVRRRLDAAGFQDTFITVSNELNEEIIEHLHGSGAPVNTWGVGTHMVTGGSESSFTGVYKLAALRRDGIVEPSMKISDNPEKSTNPGMKSLFRLYGEDGSARADLITLEGEEPRAGRECHAHHPSGDWREFKFVPAKVERLLEPVMEDGLPVGPPRGVGEARTHMRERIGSFDSTYLRLLNPHLYKVSISTKLRDSKLSYIKKYFRNR